VVVVGVGGGGGVVSCVVRAVWEQWGLMDRPKMAVDLLGVQVNVDGKPHLTTSVAG
jgi:hypothetical protein